MPRYNHNNSQLLLDLVNYSGRIPHYERIIRNTLGVNCPYACYRIPAYLHSWQEDCAASYPHIVLDRYRFGYFQALDAGIRLKEMGGSNDLDRWPNHGMVV